MILTETKLSELRRDASREAETILLIRKAWRRFNRVVRGAHHCPRKSRVHRRLDSVVCVRCWKAADDFVKAVGTWQHAAWAAARIDVARDMAKNGNRA